MIRPFDPLAPFPAHDVCVVGAGPVGLALALRAADHGLKVLLIEAGEDRPRKAARHPADRIDPRRHAPMDVAAARALGGTSWWWGGRCVPFDPVDFGSRPWVVGPGWPLSAEELAPWLAAAVDFLGCGPPAFTAREAGWPSLGPVRFDTLERWTPEPSAVRRRRRTLATHPNVEVLLQATATHVALSGHGEEVERLSLRGPAGTAELRPKRLVIAAGGVETTRLLLASRRTQPRAFGGPDGPLGRFYMGHLSGRIADLILHRPADVRWHDFFRDGASYARRRLTFAGPALAEHGLLDIAFWADNPRFHDARHRDPLLSLVWLGLAAPVTGPRLLPAGVRLSHLGPKPWRALPHLANVLRRPDVAAGSLAKALYGRYLARPRAPGFLVHNASGRYSLHYHAEQSPGRESRIRLLDGGAGDLPAIDIDLRFSDADIASVVRAHDRLDEALRAASVAHLDFHAPSGARAALVDAQATDGFHQLGSTRMAAHAEDGVVDQDLRVHGTSNLYVASSSVFPTSGQANPTLLAVMLGLRLADHLAAAMGRAP